MTVLTDIPVSGIYFQQGAIVQIVATLLDAETGEPINLGTATGLSITIAYPDGLSAATFPASLYTDGSDGMIAYTTRNNGSTIVDLSQNGMYFFQGNAAIGGVTLPPSYQGDFYVLPNVNMNGSPSPLFNASALILFAPNGTRYGVVVNPDGSISVAAAPTGPTSFLQFQNLIMKDSDGLPWDIEVTNVGAVVPLPHAGQANTALSSFLLSDTAGETWVMTVSTAGVLQAG